MDLREVATDQVDHDDLVGRGTRTVRIDRLFIFFGASVVPPRVEEQCDLNARKNESDLDPRCMYEGESGRPGMSSAQARAKPERVRSR